MTRTLRKRLCSARIAAQLTRRDHARKHGPQPAAALLRDEAARISRLQPFGTPKAQMTVNRMAWAYILAAAWLDSRNDPACIHQWQEIKPERRP